VLRDAPFAVMVGDHRRSGGPGAAFWFGQVGTSKDKIKPTTEARRQGEKKAFAADLR
jgi:hypothetical protein